MSIAGAGRSALTPALTPALARAIVEQSPTPIWHCGADGKCNYFNPAWVRHAGRTLEQALADGWEHGIHQEDSARCAELFRRRQEDRQPFEIGYRRLRHDGVYREVLDRAVPLHDPAGTFTGFMGHCVDVHDHRRHGPAGTAGTEDMAGIDRGELLEREQHARADAEAANRMKDEFLATLSHELRTPLTAILGWIQLLRTGTLTAVKQAHALDTIESSAKLQAQLVADILDVSRIITGKLRLELKWVDLEQVVNAAVETLMPAAVAKGIAIGLRVDPQTESVRGDPERLQQVMWNLLSNAIKFCRRGGQVMVKIASTDTQVEVAITDDGEGIPADVLPHVFERFQQGDSSMKRRHGGLGLGLAIVRHLVELHGGTAEATSPGKGLGATFRVQLPRLVAPAAGLAHAPVAQDPAAPDLAGLHVVVLDDDAALREILGTFLERNGARVSSVSSVAEALKTVDLDRPDAVISDISMPNEDGYDFVRKLRALDRTDPPIPTLALTAHARNEERHRTLSAGFHAHMTKPVDMKQLIAVVARLCRRP